MRNRKRVRICLSLLLAGAMSLSGAADIRANMELEVEKEDHPVNSANIPEEYWEEPDTDADGIYIGESETAGETVSEDEVYPDTVSEDTGSNGSTSDGDVGSEESVSGDAVSDQEEEPVILSENGADPTPALSDDNLSSDELAQDGTSGEKDPEQAEEVLEVIFPTSIPLEMVAFGKERLEGMIKSEQFCIENVGKEDVRISIQGSCSGNSGEDHVVADSSVLDNPVPGKKSVWINMQWEDKDGRVLEEPGIAIRDASDPGKGEILLRAPKRNKEGEIIDGGSKAYFSFTGDMKSDTGEMWEDREIRVTLDFSAERAEAGDSNPTAQHMLQE